MRGTLIAILMLFTYGAVAQPNLLPSIGIGPMPSDNDPVCTIPWYLGSFYTSGLAAGDTAYDFTLYDLNGDSLNLAEALSHGKPVLLVAGSYTCPVYRGKVAALNNVVTTYAGLVDVYIIYTIEAHPIIDTSVYFGYVNPTTTNLQAGITYRQPQTYGERKQVATEMLDSMNTLAPVFIDGPCNNWWSVYGPAPNNAYLIDTNGVVFAKHGWFDKYPDNIYCDLDSLLGTSFGSCGTVGGTANITYQQTSADTVYDEVGMTISVDGQLHNPGSQDVIVMAKRLQNDLPIGWATSMCMDVCYATNIDSVQFVIPAGATQDVHVYFYTEPTTPGTGHVKLGFRNTNNPSNQFTAHYWATSTLPLGVINPSETSVFHLFPNPVTDRLYISGYRFEPLKVELFNRVGQLVQAGYYTNVIDVSGLQPGLYFARSGSFVHKFFKQ